MARMPLPVLLLLLLLVDSQAETKEYIVYTGMKKVSALKMLHAIGRPSSPIDLLYVYKRSFHGFVVKLTEQQRHRMSNLEGVVSVFPNEKKQLHTTRSWDFLGLPEDISRAATETDIIVGVLDTGIWPESPSFNDKDLGPPPSKWRGICQPSPNFVCNNKIIGARYYKANSTNFEAGDILSPRDSQGHGSHTASTAAGRHVMASLMGLGAGTARGAVPSARIAVYKICWFEGCSDANILQAFDDAVADGVDLISLSVGGRIARPYFIDSIAIGAFHAMKNGILTSVSAGNAGPVLSSTVNVAPWLLSVAANTMDRKFFAKVLLGNNESFEGISVNTFDLNNTMYPLVYGGDVPSDESSAASSRLCKENSIDPKSVEGKIVLCDALSFGQTPFLAGATGTVMQDEDPKHEQEPRSCPLPASFLDADNGSHVYHYMKSIRNPTATIMKSTEGNDTSAPSVATFSSRGPSIIAGDILKPDLTAPGVNILAAWSPLFPMTPVKGDKRMVQYNVGSGTSMACPHATGAAAYVKSYHPTWSPAAIKSALMTTASPMTGKNSFEAEFAYGAGQINPFKAVNPGLVYETTTVEYIQFLCGQNYTPGMLQLVTGENVRCSNVTTGEKELNYPSFALSTSSSNSVKGVFSRRVTNVGFSDSTYIAMLMFPRGLNIQVNPNILSFSSIGEQVSFTLTVEGEIGKNITSASLVWDDGVHQVRSPLVVYLK